MGVESIQEALKNMDLVRDLEPVYLEKLATMARRVDFPANVIIFREGELSDTIYLLERGHVAVEIYVPGRGKTTLLTLGPGQMLGWSPLFMAKPNSASGRTMEPTQALALDAAQLRTVCQEDHQLGCVLGWRVAKVIAGRLRATRLQLLDIFAPGL